MKKILRSCVSLVIISSLVLTGCSTSVNEVNQINNQQISSNSLETFKKSDLIIEKNINVGIEKASIYGNKVEIASSFGHFTANTSDLVKKSESVMVNQLSPQLITLSDDNSNTKTPLALSLVANPIKAQSILISPQTTAEALVFMDPNVATVDLDLADRVMNIIKSLPETKELAKVIEQRTIKEPDFLYKDNQQQNQALTKAVNAVVNKLADEYDKNTTNEAPNRVDGVEIKTVSQNDSTGTFELKNYKKRYVSLYFNEEVSGNSIPVHNESLSSPNDFIDFNNISLGFKPFIKQTEFNIQKPIKNVEVIGLGLKDIKEFKEKWSSMNISEKMKYGMPIGQSLMFDFVSPVISIIMGFNINKVYNAGLLRILSSLPVLQIIDAFKNKEYGRAFKTILSGTVKALLNQNGALLRELLLKVGLNLTEAFIKRLNAAIGIFNLARFSLEAGRALYAYSTTHITSYFKVDSVNGSLLFTRKE
ncbi:MAG: hypothetical protein U0354_02995 [Candidatus Sericytochromatia bacterium]